MGRTRVLVVDDSAVMRQLLSEILSADPSLEVVGVACDGVIARTKLEALNPDVITLDVEMPRQDGLAFLESIMRERPTRVVMVSSLTEKSCATTLRALELGAIDFVTKPQVDVRTGAVAIADELVAKVRDAARAQLRRPRGVPSSPPPAAPRPRPVAPVAPAPGAKIGQMILAIGASTGGTEALREVLSAVPPDAPGIVVVQHMPERFTRAFAERLDSCCRIRVREAADGDLVLPGHALIAPGNFHMRVVRNGAGHRVVVSNGDRVNRHRPSVDVLFDSCAEVLGPSCVGVILTGMGDDGARGMKRMHDAGARTIAQDEATCVVYGMPREAVAHGAADEVLPLGRIAAAMLRFAGMS